jgi:hypothetical protein
MKKLIILVFSIVLLGSCNQTKYISNGLSDNKPLIFEDEYQCKNLKELNLEGSAFWGIPKSTKLSKEAKHNSGRIISFNGVRIMGSTKLLPVIGMIAYTAVVGTSLSAVFGQKIDYYDNWGYPYYKQRLPLLPAIVLGIPIAGALNNLTFSNSALGVAGSGINYKLITENPDVDIFYYPKYEISKSIKFWTQKAYLKANVKGATQIISSELNLTKKSKTSNSKIKNTLTIDKNDFITFKNQELKSNYEIILDYNKISYRGFYVKKEKGKVTLKNIEKLSDEKWIQVYNDKTKTYSFPKSSLIGFKK